MFKRNHDSSKILHFFLNRLMLFDLKDINFSVWYLFNKILSTSGCKMVPFLCTGKSTSIFFLRWLYSLGDGLRWRFLKIRGNCMDFETRFKVNNLFSVHPKSIKLGQMTTLTWSYGCRLVKDVKLAPVHCAISEWQKEGAASDWFKKLNKAAPM